jgi:hypothetical protein
MDISMVYMCIGFEHYLEPHKKIVVKFQSFEHVHPFIHDWVKKLSIN